MAGIRHDDQGCFTAHYIDDDDEDGMKEFFEEVIHEQGEYDICSCVEFELHFPVLAIADTTTLVSPTQALDHRRISMSSNLTPSSKMQDESAFSTPQTDPMTMREPGRINDHDLNINSENIPKVTPNDTPAPNNPHLETVFEETEIDPEENQASDVSVTRSILRQMHTIQIGVIHQLQVDHGVIEMCCWIQQFEQTTIVIITQFTCIRCNFP